MGHENILAKTPGKWKIARMIDVDGRNTHAVRPRQHTGALQQQQQQRKAIMRCQPKALLLITIINSCNSGSRTQKQTTPTGIDSNCDSLSIKHPSTTPTMPAKRPCCRYQPFTHT